MAPPTRKPTAVDQPDGIEAMRQGVRDMARKHGVNPLLFAMARFD